MIQDARERCPCGALLTDYELDTGRHLCTECREEERERELGESGA